MLPIVVYFHICTINNWKEIVVRILNLIKESKLYDHVGKIKCCVLGCLSEKDLILFHDPKIEICVVSSDISMYERITLDQLWKDSQTADFKMLYLHSKGIKYMGRNRNVNDWVDYLLYFNVTLWEKNVHLLDSFDISGVNLQGKPAFHYSGNFWWSNSAYIRNLNQTIGPRYTDPEMWVCSKYNNIVSLWNSNINHYHARYKKDMYVNKELKLIEVHKAK